MQSIPSGGLTSTPCNTSIDVARPSENDPDPQTRSERTLRLMEEQFGEATIGELAHAVFQAEASSESPAAVHEDLFDRVLPSLEERGELRFDVERGVVTLHSDDGDGPLGRLQEWLAR